MIRILNDIEVNEPEIVKISNELKFDFPHSKKIENDKVVHILEEDINEIEVIDPVKLFHTLSLMKKTPKLLLMIA